MPIRVKPRAVPPERDLSPGSVAGPMDWDLPQITQDDSFPNVIKKLSIYIAEVVDLPSTFEQLRNTPTGECLRVLVDHLGKTCKNAAILNALLALRWHYSAERERRGLARARADACEIVAWRFLARVSEREAVDYCLHEIPGNEALDASPVNTPSFVNRYDEEANEYSPLLPLGNSRNGGKAPVGSILAASRRAELLQAIPKITFNSDDVAEDPRSNATAPANTFKSLNALEIAGIANAKRFLSQDIVQKIMKSIWDGEIIFWDSVSADAYKKPRYYNPSTADPYSRLRVPKYLKTWEVVFFVTFLVLYYSVVVERNMDKIPLVEIMFYIWLTSFLWDEFQEWVDAGVFYLSDLWNIFDMSMITIGIVFATLRVIGISLDNRKITALSFNVLSLEALLVVPRICSFLSLSPYWGTLIPCLKEMGKDFIKFVILVIILYMGFLTTFSLMAHDSFTPFYIIWSLTKIFYGNTGIGFEIMREIDPNFGPPLMILFITLSSILLTGSLTGMLSNSFSRVMAQAREEYLFFYSVYVLEASTSSRLTHFYPPLNLISLFFFHPWRIIFYRDDRFRRGRVAALKITHFPIVSVIFIYEWIWRKISDYKERDDWERFKGGRTRSNSEAPNRGRPPIGRPRGSGSPYRPSANYRRLDRYLESGLSRADSRSLSSSARKVAEEVKEPTNTELLARIDKLTEMIMNMENKESARKGKSD